MSNILLRLDVNAMNSLFPEGTQARLDLQQAVIAEIIRRQIKPSALGDVSGQIEAARLDALAAVRRAREEAAARVFEEQGVTKSSWGGVTLKPGAVAVINEAARHAVQREITDAVAAQVKESAEKLRGTVSHDTKAAVNRMIDAEINTLLKARFSEVMEKMLKIAP